jgi:glycosyltransferase involved in cell wall biosynthesis
MDTPFLSLALLNYNERDTIERAARLCAEVLDRCGTTYELVLVDDGSTDGSRELIERLAGELPFCRAHLHPRNLGIGAGIRTCYFETRGQWATWFPADLQADPNELPRLLEHLRDCDVLITYRDPEKRAESFKRKFISAGERFLVRALFGLSLRDLHWIRFFRREFLERMELRSTSPFIDTEMVVAAKRLGARIAQVELADHPRQFGEAKGARLRNLLLSFRDLAALRLRTLPGFGTPTKR